MAGLEAAATAMIGLSALGILLSEGEKTRLRYVRALRRCVLRISSIIAYERPELVKLLLHVDLRATPQERELTALLHACAKGIESGTATELSQAFAHERNKRARFGVLGEEDCHAFEQMLCELGKTGLDEQLRLLSRADERLRRREEELFSESQRRAKLISTLGITAGAAAFLVLI